MLKIRADDSGFFKGTYNGRLRADIFAERTFSQLGDGRVAASRDDDRVSCSEAGIDAAAPLYSKSPRVDRTLRSRADSS